MGHEKLLCNELILCPANMIMELPHTKQNSVSSQEDYEKHQRNKINSVSSPMGHEKLLCNELILCPANMIMELPRTKQNSVFSRMDYAKMQRNEQNSVSS
jgi:hypothetical protein